MTAGEDRHAIEHSAPVSRESQRGTAGPAADGERAGARRASGRRASGPAGGRAGGSGGSSDTLSGGSAPQDSAGGSSGSGTQLPSGSGTQLPTDSLPSLPTGTSPTGGGTGGIDLQAPELPTVTPREGTTVPEVQVPETGVPPVDGVTGDVEEVTNGLTGTLP